MECFLLLLLPQAVTTEWRLKPLSTAVTKVKPFFNSPFQKMLLHAGLLINPMFVSFNQMNSSTRASSFSTGIRLE